MPVEAPDQAAAEQLRAEDPDQVKHRENGTDTFIANPLA